MRLLAVAIVACAGGSRARAQGWTAYDAALGTLPDAQGWTAAVDVDPPAPYVLELVGGDLHLSTLGLQATGTAGGAVYWQRTDVPIDFTTGFAFEADLRVASAPDHSVNQQSGWPRPGYELLVQDVHQHAFMVGFGSDEIFLSNSQYGQYGSANTVTASFNTTDRHHVYRIQQAPGGVGASLLIDGVPTLTLAALGPTYSGGACVLFGDGTYWANSETYTALVRCTAAVAGVGPPSPGGTLWAAPLGNPGGSLRVAFRAARAGRLEFDCVDAAGRQIAHASRDVTPGAGDVIVVPEARQSGLYFYRLRLQTPDGLVEGSGRALLVR